MEIGKDLGGKFMNKEKLVAGTSRWDRYLGMTAAMTQVPVPTARVDSLRISLYVKLI